MYIRYIYIYSVFPTKVLLRDLEAGEYAEDSEDAHQAEEGHPGQALHQQCQQRDCGGGDTDQS